MLVNRVHKPYSCRICGNKVGIKVCKCQKAYYCSRNCQKIDWKVHKSDCFKLVEHPNSNKNLPNNSSIVTETSANQLLLQQLQNSSELLVTSPQHGEISRERQQTESADKVQYQQQPSISTNTIAQSSTIEDFGENLLNSLMYSVDESTEKEILKNLDISEDELLKSINLDTENSSSFDEQNLRDYQSINADQVEDQSFEEKIFERIQRQESFELKPEYKETRDKLEKELSLFREINLHEPQQQLGRDTGSDIMKISSNNPKYINHTKLDDHMLYK